MVIAKSKKYNQENQIGKEDLLFIVSDKDRWKSKSLHEVNEFCSEFENYFFILSNPCFEVWLFYHIGNPGKENANTSKAWKKLVHEKTINGFKIENYVGNIFDAINKAKKDDTNPNHFLTHDKHSKVYKIIEAIIEKVGEGNFRLFINKFL